MNKDTSYGQIKHFLRQLLLLCYWITPLVDYRRVLVDESGVFPLSASFHHGSPFLYITSGMNNRNGGGRNSET
jgi:hypothetical protein